MAGFDGSSQEMTGICVSMSMGGPGDQYEKMQDE
jgi:hypothetical protein